MPLYHQLLLKLGKRGSIYLAVIGGVLIVTGIALAIIGKGIKIFKKNDYEIVYTDIGNCNFEKSNTTCPEYMKTHKINFCVCRKDFVLPKDFRAPVNIYYELESFDQSSISESRDNEQLSGVLSLTPSASCGNYTYSTTSDGRKPIAPCGALADALFNDTFNILLGKHRYNKTPGVLDEADKIGFHNPPGNLTEAFANFSKPINWFDKKWKAFLDTERGFENEQFIGWMRTDWKRKPYARINEDLLNSTPYTLKVGYYYPPSRYNGERKIILSSLSTEYQYHICFVIGFIFLGIGSLFFGAGLVAFWLIERHIKDLVLPPVEEPLRS